MTDESAFAAVCQELARGRRFLITSHARPDGDSIGSQMALALALEYLGKQVRVVNADPPPVPYRKFPAVDRIEVAPAVDGDADAAIVLECSDLSRPGLAGLERFRIVNIDHHPGATPYGAVNWFEPTAAACAELVVAVTDALGVPMTRAIATHVYLAILTDTGSFHHAGITARTFDICRRAVEAGVDPAEMANLVFDSASVGRLRLLGRLLETMAIEADGRLAVLTYDDDLLEALGASPDDTEGLINVPLSARTIEAVALLRGQRGTSDVRVSLRSKGAIDVRQVAHRFGGGGHVNAAGCTLPGPLEAARTAIVEAVAAALDHADRTRR